MGFFLSLTIQGGFLSVFLHRYYKNRGFFLPLSEFIKNWVLFGFR